MAFPTTYADFLLVDRANKKTPIGEFLVEAVSQSYTLSLFVKGRTIEQLTQGGTAITDFIQTADNNSFGFYGPGDQQTPVSADTLKQISLPWRFSQCNFAWETEEMELNEDDVDKFLNLDDAYRSGAVMAQVNGTEASLWTVPATADMEASTGKVPYSIPCFINEFTSTIPTGFTTVMGVNPSTTSRWRNQKSAYTAANIGSPSDTTGLLMSLMDCAENTRFRTVDFGKSKSLQEKEMLDRMGIVTSLDGLKQYQKALFNANDRTVSVSDAGNKTLQFRGYPMEQVTALATAAIYSSTLAASHTSGVANAGYPRYYFLNGEYLKPIFHSKKFMEPGTPINGGQERPNSWVQYFWTKQNLWCRSRQRLGIVYPSA